MKNAEPYFQQWLSASATKNAKKFHPEIRVMTVIVQKVAR